MTDFGHDFSFRDGDMDANLSGVSGLRLVAERLQRRYMTQRGTWRPDPTFGYCLTDLINEKSPDPLAEADNVQAEALKDEAVLEATARVAFSGGTLTIFLRVQTSYGPLELVMAASALTVELLSSTIDVNL